MISPPNSLEIKAPKSSPLRSPRNANTQSMIFSRGFLKITPPIYSKNASPASARKPGRSTLSTFTNTLDELCDTIDNADFSTINWSKMLPKRERFKALNPKKQVSEAPFEDCKNRWIKREIPSTFANNRTHNSFLAHSLKENMGSITIKYPTYFENLDFTNSDSIPFRMESEVWMFFLNEIISEVAETSKSAALLLETMRSRLSVLFEKMVDFLEEEKKVVEVVKTVVKEAPSELENARLSSQNEILTKKITFLESDFSKLLQENAELKREALNARVQQQQTEARAQKLMEINAETRQQIIDQNQKIFTLSQNNHIFKSSGSLGNVPKDVIQIWEHVSHFIMQIENGKLEEIDFSQYFPLSTSSFEPPFFTLPINKEHIPNQDGIHYSTFFDIMRKVSSSFDPSKLQSNLENHIRKMLNKMVNVYLERIKTFSEEKNNAQLKFVGEMESLRKENIEGKDWIKLFIDNPNAFKPKKQTSEDFLACFDTIASKTVDTYNKHKESFPRSTNEAIVNSLDFENLVSFLKSISDGQQKHVVEFLLNKTISKNLPFHAFFFMCNVLIMMKEQTPENVFRTLFDHLGWKHANDNETMFTGFENSIHYFLCAYLRCIDNIANEVMKKKHNDILVLLKNEEIEEDEAKKMQEFLLRISENGIITEKEVAVFHFWKRNSFDLFPEVFDINEDPLIVEINDSILKKKSKKKGKK